MDKRTVTISMPKNSTQEEILAMRNKYKEYRVNIIISGEINQEKIIRNFLKARLEV